METDDLTFSSSNEYIKAVCRSLMMSEPSMDLSTWETSGFVSNGCAVCLQWADGFWFVQ